MNPAEEVVNIFDGLVTDYPFDKHCAYLELYFMPGKEAAKDKTAEAAPKPAEAAPTPKPEAPAAGEEQKKEEEKKTEAAKPDEDEISIGSISWARFPVSRSMRPRPRRARAITWEST